MPVSPELKAARDRMQIRLANPQLGTPTWSEVKALAAQLAGQRLEGSSGGFDLGEELLFAGCQFLSHDRVCDQPAFKTFLDARVDRLAARANITIQDVPEGFTPGRIPDARAVLPPTQAAAVASNLSAGPRNLTSFFGSPFPRSGPGFQLPTGPGLPPPRPDLVGSLASTCRSLGIPDFLCTAGEVALRRGSGGGGGARSKPLVACPDGFEFDASSGTCRATGMRGTVERTLPGGETGVMAGGEATVGSFGMPAMFPNVVGQITSIDGTRTSPILRCMRGMVLGTDNLCYRKPLARQHRKWPPASKPPMSAADAKALRRIGTLKRKAKKLATDAGLSCSTRSRSRK